MTIIHLCDSDVPPSSQHIQFTTQRYKSTLLSSSGEATIFKNKLTVYCTVYCNVTPRSLVPLSHSLEGTSCIHVHDRRQAHSESINKEAKDNQ